VDGIHLLSHESSRGGFAVPAPNNRGLRLYPRSNEVILNPIQLFLKSNNKSLEDDDLVESSLQSPASHDCTVKTPSSGRKGLFSGVRSYMRAATGFSITSLRATMRAATGVSITKLVKKFTGMIPIGLRFIFQPFLILYFWPLFLFRCLLGLSKDSKIEARQNHNRFVTSWKDAVKAAQEANESDKWPFNVISEDVREILDITKADTRPLLAQDVTEFVETNGGYNNESLNDSDRRETEFMLKTAVDEEVEKVSSKHASTGDKIDSTAASGTSVSVDRMMTTKEAINTYSVNTEQETSANLAQSYVMLDNMRWAMSSDEVDLTGKWYLLEDEGFKEEYDEYLKALGQPSIVRAVALTLIGLTREETIQEDGGRTLIINGVNPRGIWNRKLISSGWDPSSESTGENSFEPIYTTIQTADGEDVQAEAWWEEQGTVHKSWLRGGLKYGGGDFESSRYLSVDGKELICTSIFHPKNPRAMDRKEARVTWKFRREGY